MEYFDVKNLVDSGIYSTKKLCSSILTLKKANHTVTTGIALWNILM